MRYGGSITHQCQSGRAGPFRRTAINKSFIGIAPVALCVHQQPTLRLYEPYVAVAISDHAVAVLDSMLDASTRPKSLSYQIAMFLNEVRDLCSPDFLSTLIQNGCSIGAGQQDVVVTGTKVIDPIEVCRPAPDSTESH